jgi:hypothetical protein
MRRNGPPGTCRGVSIGFLCNGFASKRSIGIDFSQRLCNHRLQKTHGGRRAFKAHHSHCSWDHGCCGRRARRGLVFAAAEDRCDVPQQLPAAARRDAGAMRAILRMHDSGHGDDIQLPDAQHAEPYDDCGRTTANGANGDCLLAAYAWPLAILMTHVGAR